MTTTFRKSGSFVACTWHGDLPDDVPAALPARRFRSIDSAASEEVSVGWVSR